MSPHSGHEPATERGHHVENLPALEKGLANLQRHVENVTQRYGLPCVVSVNHFTADTEAEHALLSRKAAEWGVPLHTARHWAEGGKGAEDLARTVVDVVEGGESAVKFVYEDSAPLWEKIESVARKIYGAAGISADAKVRAQISELGTNLLVVSPGSSTSSSGVPSSWLSTVRLKAARFGPRPGQRALRSPPAGRSQPRRRRLAAPLLILRFEAFWCAALQIFVPAVTGRQSDTNS